MLPSVHMDIAMFYGIPEPCNKLLLYNTAVILTCSMVRAQIQLILNLPSMLPSSRYYMSKLIHFTVVILILCF